MKGGATICMVTHDPRYAEYAERNISLFDGRIVEEKVRGMKFPQSGWLACYRLSANLVCYFCRRLEAGSSEVDPIF